MTNVESMDYTHFYLSTIASLFGTVHCPLSPWELVQTSPVHPNPVIWYALSHINLLISSSKQPPYLPIYGISIAIPRYIAMQLSTVPFIIIMTYITFVILPLHDHVVDIVFVANPTMHNFLYMSLLIHCTIPVHRRRHSYRVISCSSFELCYYLLFHTCASK